MNYATTSDVRDAGFQQLKQSDAARGPVPAHVPDIAVHINRAAALNDRLNALADTLEGFMGRLYGPQDAGSCDMSQFPPSAGASGQMADRLRAAEAMVERIESAVSRLQQFA